MTDLGVVIAIIGGVVAMIGVMIALFLWTRSEASTERRELAAIITTFKDVVLIEMKDFHGRLCALEEKIK